MFRLRRIRRFSTIAFKSCKRVPLAEELAEPVVLSKGQMRADQQSDVKGFQVPLLQRHLTGSLEAEFGRPPHGRRTVATDWSAYADPIESDAWEQAARLIHLTLASLPKGTSPRSADPGSPGEGERRVRTRLPPAEYGLAELTWIQEETEQLWKEISEGDYKTRWSMADHHPNQSAVLEDARGMLAANPKLHPLIKEMIMRQMNSIVAAANPTSDKGGKKQ